MKKPSQTGWKRFLSKKTESEPESIALNRFQFFLKFDLIVYIYIYIKIEPNRTENYHHYLSIHK